MEAYGEGIPSGLSYQPSEPLVWAVGPHGVELGSSKLRCVRMVPADFSQCFDGATRHAL